MEKSPDSLALNDKSWRFLTTLSVGLIGFANSIIVGTFIGVIALNLFGEDIIKNIGFNLFYLAISDLAFLFVIVIFLKTENFDVAKSLKINLPAKYKYWLYVIPAFFGYVILSAILTLAAKWLLPQFDLEQTQEIIFKNASGNVEIIIAAIALIIIAPIGEELVFRGFIYKGFRKSFGVFVAVILSSLLFGVVHGQINIAIDTFCLGIFLCYLYEKTDSIWVPIVLHSIKNGIAFYLIFFTNITV